MNDELHIDPGLIDALDDGNDLGPIGEPISTLPRLKKASAEMLALARAGRCESGLLRGFSQLAAVQLRVLESLDQEKRLKRLEKTISGGS
jgi:hypothetical protein